MKKAWILGLVSATAWTLADARTPAPPPHLEAHGQAVQLVVDGKPFLMLGGELGNSTASDPDYLRPFWPRLQALHLNTVLAPVYWELIEPQEGVFDFSRLDTVMHDARQHHMHLVLLWFGSWKNSMSSYAPAWVKRDAKRFPRARTSDGRALEELSAFSAENRDADARAFAALMRRLRETDDTVLMVQVENEIGMIPEARDHSPEADAAFAGQVPSALTDYLVTHHQTLAAPLRARWEANGARTTGAWEDVFGPGDATDEIFMAWHFAAYTNAVAAAGRAQYALPLYVNAALMRPGKHPGEYPSAGPLPQVFDVWRAGAPAIDFLAPDIYFPNYVEWSRAYHVAGSGYFVPETGRQPDATPANAFYSFAADDAMGFSPFAIEDFDADDPLGRAYGLLDGLSPLILAHQGDGSMVGVRPVVAFDGAVDAAPQDVQLGGYTLHVSFIDQFTPVEHQNLAARGGLIIALGPDEFLVAGRGLTITFSASQGLVGIESIWEGRYEGGAWKPGRLLNGDQSHQGRHLRLPLDDYGVERVRLYRYE
jgi:beta-galactosidase GanA